MTVSVPAAKAALIAQLTVRPGLAGVHVGWGLPPTVPRERERIFVLGAEEMTRTGDSRGGVRDETYLLPVVIEVHQDGTGDAQPVEQRAWDLFDEITAAVADDAELGGSVWHADIDRAEEGESGPTGEGWLAQIIARVRITTKV